VWTGSEAYDIYLGSITLFFLVNLTPCLDTRLLVFEAIHHPICDPKQVIPAMIPSSCTIYILIPAYYRSGKESFYIFNSISLKTPNNRDIKKTLDYTFLIGISLAFENRERGGGWSRKQGRQRELQK
jgi:hypothetical protein